MMPKNCIQAYKMRLPDVAFKSDKCIIITKSKPPNSIEVNSSQGLQYVNICYVYNRIVLRLFVLKQVIRYEKKSESRVILATKSHNHSVQFKKENLNHTRANYILKP